MIVGEKEYDVYVLVERRRWWQWIIWWSVPSYQILVGTSFADADEAAKNAEYKTNASGGMPIGIAADAIVCCRERQTVIG